MKEFSTFRLIDILGETRAAIQQKIDRGIYHPSVSKASGRGTKSLFTEDDIFRILLTKLLSDNGFSLNMSARISRLYHKDFINAIHKGLKLIILRDILRRGFLLLGDPHNNINDLLDGNISDHTLICAIRKRQNDWYIVEKDLIKTIETDHIDKYATLDDHTQMTSISIIDLEGIAHNVEKLD